MIDQERELRAELDEQIRREVEGQVAESTMTEHWERAYGDE